MKVEAQVNERVFQCTSSTSCPLHAEVTEGKALKKTTMILVFATDMHVQSLIERRQSVNEGLYMNRAGCHEAGLISIHQVCKAEGTDCNASICKCGLKVVM